MTDPNRWLVVCDPPARAEFWRLAKKFKIAGLRGKEYKSFQLTLERIMEWAEAYAELLEEAS